MKKRFLPLLSVFVVALVLAGCAGTGGSTVSRNALVGDWVERRAEIITAMHLRADGSYERTDTKVGTRVSARSADWLISRSSGTWDAAGRKLILHQTKMESGIVPKNPVREIAFQITELTPTSISLKWKDTVEVYTKKK